MSRWLNYRCSFLLLDLSCGWQKLHVVYDVEHSEHFEPEKEKDQCFQRTYSLLCGTWFNELWVYSFGHRSNSGKFWIMYLQHPMHN
jgi:hypothetical protein